MTVPREWPNGARAARDAAADEIATALKFTMALTRNGSSLTLEDQTKLLSLVIYHEQNALRWLESAGAQTRPASM